MKAILGAAIISVWCCILGFAIGMTAGSAVVMFRLVTGG